MCGRYVCVRASVCEFVCVAFIQNLLFWICSHRNYSSRRSEIASTQLHASVTESRVQHPAAPPVTKPYDHAGSNCNHSCNYRNNYYYFNVDCSEAARCSPRSRLVRSRVSILSLKLIGCIIKSCHLGEPITCRGEEEEKEEKEIIGVKMKGQERCDSGVREMIKERKRCKKERKEVRMKKDYTCGEEESEKIKRKEGKKRLNDVWGKVEVKGGAGQ